MKLKNLTNIKWIGGKHGKEELYISLMLEHKIYVDCFFGSGAVTFYKEIVNPAKITIVNDINDKLINYMLQLKNNSTKLYEECASLPFSESLYNKYKWDPWPTDELEQAVRFYYLMRCCFGGGGHKYRNGIGLSKDQNKAKQLRSATELIPQMADYIRNWNILCRDFEEVIKFYDTKDTLFFIDAPYFDRERLYSGEFQKTDHERLYNILADIKGKAIVCYYEHDEIDKLYQDWHRIEYSKASQIKKRELGEKMDIRKEVIYMNYFPSRQMTINI